IVRHDRAAEGGATADDGAAGQHALHRIVGDGLSARGRKGQDQKDGGCKTGPGHGRFLQNWCDRRMISCRRQDQPAGMRGWLLVFPARLCTVRAKTERLGEQLMRLSHFAAAAVIGIGLTAMALARDVPESGPAADGSPAWFIDHAADIHVHNYATQCVPDAAKFCSGKTDQGLRTCLSSNKARVSQSCQTALAMPWQEGGFDTSKTPPCVRSVICTARAVNNPDGVDGGA